MEEIFRRTISSFESIGSSAIQYKTSERLEKVSWTTKSRAQQNCQVTAIVFGSRSHKNILHNCLFLYGYYNSKEPWVHVTMALVEVKGMYT